MFFNSSKGVLIEFLPPNIKERGGIILPFPGLIVRLGLLDGEVLLGNLNLGGAHVVAGVAHDVGVLIHQEDVVLRKLINRLQEDFVKEGGVREKMTKARLEYRGKNKTN